MNRVRNVLRKPVRRVGAERYLLLTLFSFAVSVSLTRLFLELTGYPKIGGEVYHIAHVLWGGLLLFIATLLPLLLANRWSYTLSAILSGAGVGLFIDEVGKFITANNDYFFPLAAPIIYASFLLVVLIYLQVRRTIPREPRTEIFAVLDALEEVIEHDLEEHEYAQLKDQLQWLAGQEKSPEIARFASVLNNALPQLTVKPESTSFIERVIFTWNRLTDRIFTRLRLKSILIGGLLALSLVSLATFADTMRTGLIHLKLNDLLQILITSKGVFSLNTFYWLLARILLELAVSLFLLASAAFFLFGKDRLGVFWGNLGLVFSLTVVNLIVFYFDQFSTILFAVIQFTLFLMLNAYKRRFIHPSPATSPHPSPFADG